MTTLQRFLALFFVSSQLVTVNFAQQARTPLDDYFDTADAIVVAKCIEVGPMNILLRARVRLEILHVVKGDPGLRELLVDSQFGMTLGKTYLVRTEGDTKKEATVRSNTRPSVIPIPEYESLETLRSLSPRIVVLRTMNQRINELESLISVSKYELEALRAVKKGN